VFKGNRHGYQYRQGSKNGKLRVFEKLMQKYAEHRYINE
jgi:hypothetical protein